MANKFANKSFFTRTASGIVLVLLLIASLVWGGSQDIFGGRILFFVNLFISLVAVYELYKALKLQKTILGITGYIAVVVYYALVYASQYKVSILGKQIYGKNYMMIFVVLFLIALLAEYVFTYPKYKTENISNALMCTIYAGVMLSYLYITRMEPNGAYTVWLIFLASWGCDTCAYLAGVAFGKHKMAPVLSPKKSVEGAIGGVIGAAALGAIYGSVFADKIDIPHAPVVFAIVCAIAGLVSMVGDLCASAIKRNNDIKDYGNIIPGHGGIMDRFDSVIYIAPIIYILIHIMQ